MSASGQMALQVAEAESQEVVSIRKPQTEAEYIAQTNLEIALLKEQARMKPQSICVGIVAEIKPLPSKFGKSFLIRMDGPVSYIYNGMTDVAVYKLFPLGKKVAFNYKEKKSGEHTYKIIGDLYLTF